MGSRADNVSPVSVLIEPMSHDQPLTKEAILDAAEQTLRRYGPDKTSVVDVAKALQVSHGSLYRHFPSKAALREAVTERWLQRIADPLQKIADGTEGSATDRLRLWTDTLIRAKRAYVLEDPEMFAMYTTVTLEAVKVIDTHVKLLIGQVAQIIDRGMLTGEFKPGQSKSVAKAFFMATSLFHHPVHASQWTSQEIEADFDSVWAILLSGIAKQ
ncbi:TetR family transcriptional regulator [Paenibacillus sp. p3-SID867]|uniref:TetR family transcriptional regulator n=1 Tax=Paenibacillus sp. p3-SID867 TaxID=2916363 RepID=UPI0021A4B4A5|nr:TetR family transcriptional regulator [Paenibacillus sp. p3-SID867]MCT1402483.1 TetR family transcriptional regulator [Paenibacillus sp. p3-SID867]